MKIVRMLRRLRIALAYYRRPLGEIVRWLRRSREVTNFTYDLDALNLLHLASFVAAVTGVSTSEALRYITELEEDAELRAHVRELTLASPAAATADPVARYGRRAGWYAIARAIKPAVVVETGVDKGLGTCVLAVAMRRNSAEGSAGHVYGTDIAPDAGYLVAPPYSEFATILTGDSIQTLTTFAHPIDLFISDSDHTPGYEGGEYEAATRSLAPHAVILSDNAHVTRSLWDYALGSGRRFLYFQERPLDHWYPGAGIGAAFEADADGSRRKRNG